MACRSNQNTPPLLSLLSYLFLKTPTSATLLRSLLSPAVPPSKPTLALVLSERMLNMPVQIVPPMYRMLVDEVGWAVDEGEAYSFDWYL